MPGRVVVIGSSNTDLIVNTGRLPRAGETVLGASLHRALGGKGANQAVAAARMGASAVFVGRIGKDPYGDLAYEGLGKEGIDLACVVRDRKNPSGVAIVMLDKTGQNSIIVAPGSNSALSPADVDRVKFRSGDVLVLQLEIPMDAVARAIEKGSRAGATVVLNPAPAAQLPRKLLKKVDWIIPNESEAALLTGMPVETFGQVRAAARALSGKGARNVIITLGRRGVWLYSGYYEHRLSGHKVKAVDATAAGDAFVGAFAARIADGDDPLEAISWARAAAALAVTRLGAQPSLPTSSKVKKLKTENRTPGKGD